MTTFYIKQNDTSPALDVSFEGVGGAPVNLVGATVKFLMRARNASLPVVNASAAIIDAAGGKVRYSWVLADTATPGVYDAEFEVTYADGSIETFPNSRYIEIVIADDIG